MRIILPINYKFIIFTLIMELITIPFVALFNKYTASNNILMDILGISLGFMCGAVMIYITQKSIIKFMSIKLNKSINTIGNKLYIAILFALTLGVMFFIQTQFSDSNYPSIIGGLSTGIALFITLNINMIVNKLFNNYIYLMDNHHKYLININYFDICYTSFIGFIYELCAYQISGIWLLYTNYKFFYGILSAILASLSGSIAIIVITKCLNHTPIINIQQHVRK